MKHLLTLLLATSAMAWDATNLTYIVPADPTLKVGTNDLIWKYSEYNDVYLYGNFPGRIHVGDKIYRIVTVTNITTELREIK